MSRRAVLRRWLWVLLRCWSKDGYGEGTRTKGEGVLFFVGDLSKKTVFGLKCRQDEEGARTCSCGNTLFLVGPMSAVACWAFPVLLKFD
jgi:hypothetical protein